MSEAIFTLSCLLKGVIRYTSVFMGRLARRAALSSSWQFQCNCPRCQVFTVWLKPLGYKTDNYYIFFICLSFTFDISFSGTFCSWREHRNLGEFTFHNTLGWFLQNNKIFKYNQVCGCGGHLLQVAIDGEWKCQECGSTRKPSEVKIMIMTMQLISMISMVISVTTMRISMMTEVKGVWGRNKVGRSNCKQGGKSQSFWGQYRYPPTCHCHSLNCHH